MSGEDSNVHTTFHILCNCSPGRLGAARTARVIVLYMYLYSTIRSGYLSACCSYEGSSIRAGRDGSRSLTLLWVPGISYKLHRVEQEAGTGNPMVLFPVAWTSRSGPTCPVASCGGESLMTNTGRSS